MRRVAKTSGDGMMERQALLTLLARLWDCVIGWERRVCWGVVGAYVLLGVPAVPAPVAALVAPADCEADDEEGCCAGERDGGPGGLHVEVVGGVMLWGSELVMGGWCEAVEQDGRCAMWCSDAVSLRRRERRRSLLDWASTLAR